MKDYSPYYVFQVHLCHGTPACHTTGQENTGDLECLQLLSRSLQSLSQFVHWPQVPAVPILFGLLVQKCLIWHCPFYTHRAKERRWWGSPNHSPRIQRHSQGVPSTRHCPVGDESCELHGNQDHGPHPILARRSSCTALDENVAPGKFWSHFDALNIPFTFML